MPFHAIPPAERQRRLDAVRGIGRDLGLSALLFMGVAQISENRGKGWLSWLFGYTLEHRYGYGMVHVEDSEDMLVFPEGMTWALQDLPSSSYRCPPYHAETPLGEEVASVLREWNVRGRVRIGVVGLDEMLPVADFRRLQAALPEADFVDISRAMEPARQTKSADELTFVHDSNAIAEAGWATLRDHVGVGVSVREMASEMYRAVYAAGAVETLMLVLTGTRGRSGATLVAPTGSDHVLAAGDVVTFSMELTGQGGYWVEHARQFALGPLDPSYGQLVDACVGALERFEEVAVVGATGGDVFRSCDEVVQKAGFHQGHTPGHAVGQDVLEYPRVAPYDTTVLTENTVLAFHPHVLSMDESMACYLADVFVVGPTTSPALSTVDRRPLVVGGTS